MGDKIKNFLIENVEWLVLGLAGVFVVYVAWAFYISPPVQAEVAGSSVGAGAVDGVVLNEAAEPLRQAMQSGQSLTIEVPDPLATFRAQLDGEGDNPQVEIASVFPSQPYEIAAPEIDVPVIDDSTGGAVALGALPTLPAVQVEQAYTGRVSAITVPVDTEAADAAADGDEEDVTWVTVRYALPMGPMRQAWSAAGLPLQQRATTVLRVELYRQEQGADGTWGELAKVPEAGTVPLPDMPSPGDGDRERRYLEWAERRDSQQKLITPAFFDVVAGEDPMFLPLDEDQQEDVFDENNIRRGFDPRNPGISEDEMTPEEREAVMQARREDARRRKEDRDRNRGGFPGAGGPPGGFPGGYPGGFSNDAGNTDRGDDGVTRYQNRNNRGRNDQGGGPPTGFPGSGFNPYDPSSSGFPGEFGPGFNPYDPNGQGGLGQRGAPGRVLQQGSVPEGLFDPLQRDEDIIGWAYDLTAEPGGVYRYKVVLLMRNPLYDAELPEDADTAAAQKASQLVLRTDLEQADFSDEVEVQTLTQLFLAKSLKTSGERPAFKVYRWQDGEVHAHEFANVQVGDLIGGEIDGVDFTTDWILADVRDTPGEDGSVAVLVSRAGRVDTRSDEDLTDPENLRLDEQVSDPADEEAVSDAG